MSADLEYPDEVPLTDEAKYGKTYVSRVNADSQAEEIVIAPDGKRYSDVVILPHVVHVGVCWIGFRFGEATGSCPCLLRLMANEV